MHFLMELSTPSSLSVGMSLKKPRKIPLKCWLWRSTAAASESEEKSATKILEAVEMESVASTNKRRRPVTSLQWECQQQKQQQVFQIDLPIHPLPLPGQSTSRSIHFHFQVHLLPLPGPSSSSSRFFLFHFQVNPLPGPSSSITSRSIHFHFQVYPLPSLSASTSCTSDAYLMHIWCTSDAHLYLSCAEPDRHLIVQEMFILWEHI